MICCWAVAHKYVYQVAKLKGDEREDLKVLATGVAAALAARKVSVTTSLLVPFFRIRGPLRMIMRRMCGFPDYYAEFMGI